MTTIEAEICKTLLYADMFSCPLTVRELYAKLQTKKPVQFSDFIKSLTSLKKQHRVEKVSSYYLIKDSTALPGNRKKAVKEYTYKKKKLETFLRTAVTVPWVKGVFLTGSLAAVNSPETDDIDLLIVTQNSRLWLTRLVLLILAEVLGVRIHLNTLNVRDKVCMNIFLEERTLKIVKERRSLYVAHEVVQAQPLFIRNGCDQKFLKANDWIKIYLPNALRQDKGKVCNCYHDALAQDMKIDIKPLREGKRENLFFSIVSPLWVMLNVICFIVQCGYRKLHQTREEMQINRAFFNQSSSAHKVMSTFTARKKAFRLI